MSRFEDYIKTIASNIHIPSYAKRFENVVEVVRCKDCKYRFDGEHVYNCCEQLMEKSGWITEIPVDDNWYCADGKRREDERQTN